MVDARNTSTRTSIEKITRKVVDQAADELAAYLEKLPESGTPYPRGILLVDQRTERDDTRDRVKTLRDAIDRYFGESR